MLTITATKARKSLFRLLDEVSGMMESIVDGMKIPVDECAEELDW
jgi:hypothetical protein